MTRIRLRVDIILPKASSAAHFLTPFTTNVSNHEIVDVYRHVAGFHSFAGGAGILHQRSVAALPHLFQRYYYARLDAVAVHSGLGSLHTTLGVVLGRVVVTLHVGQGTIFTLSFSMLPATPFPDAAVVIADGHTAKYGYPVTLFKHHHFGQSRALGDRTTLLLGATSPGGYPVSRSTKWDESYLLDQATHCAASQKYGAPPLFSLTRVVRRQIYVT